MRLIVCSDNHGLYGPLQKLLENYPEAEAFLHCGDIQIAPENVQEFTVVAGNGDSVRDYPESLIVEKAGYRILLVHGHQFSYFNRTEAIAKRAKELGCQIACFGHTHVFEKQEIDGVLCLNPGSMNYNRDGTDPSYAVLDLKEHTIHVERKMIKDLK